MAASNRILGKQDVAWTEQKMVPVTRLEVQRAAQRNDELSDGSGVPIKCSPPPPLLERDSRRVRLSGQKIRMRPGFELDPAVLEIRVLVIAAPKTYTSNHPLSSWLTSPGFAARRCRARLHSRLGPRAAAPEFQRSRPAAS